MQDQVRIAMVNMVAERDGERVAGWSTVRSILAEVSDLGWQRVWRMVGAMPVDAQPVVTSTFADTPVDIRGRVREIVATRTIADTLHDQRLAASVSHIEGVDQAGLAELASEGIIVEQNVVYHLPKGDALVVSVDAHGYRGAAAMKLDEALELPSLVYCKAEQKHDLARRDGDEAVAFQSEPGVIVDGEVAYADGRQGATLHRQVRRCRPSSPITETSQAPSLEMAIRCARRPMHEQRHAPIVPRLAWTTRRAELLQWTPSDEQSRLLHAMGHRIATWDGDAAVAYLVRPMIVAEAAALRGEIGLGLAGI